jgi:hypothetical protein
LWQAQGKYSPAIDQCSAERRAKDRNAADGWVRLCRERLGTARIDGSEHF